MITKVTLPVSTRQEPDLGFDLLYVRKYLWGSASGYWTTRGLPTHRLDTSRTGQLAGSSICCFNCM